MLCIFQGGQPEVLEWLLEHTAAKDEILPLPYKKSLLHHAAKFGQVSFDASYIIIKLALIVM